MTRSKNQFPHRYKRLIHKYYKLKTILRIYNIYTSTPSEIENSSPPPTMKLFLSASWERDIYIYIFNFFFSCLKILLLFESRITLESRRPGKGLYNGPKIAGEQRHLTPDATSMHSKSGIFFKKFKPNINVWNKIKFH